MKVKEMIKKLEKFDQDMEVFQSIDEEGNGYNKTAEIDTLFKSIHNDNDFYNDEQDMKDGDEDNVIEDFKEVVILWPLGEMNG